MSITYVPAGANIVHDVIDGEVMMINLDSGNYYTMNETGAFIWSLLQQKASFDQLTQATVQSFELSQKEIETDVKDFLNHLLKEGLIKEEQIPAPSTLKPAVPQLSAYIRPQLLVFNDMQDLLLLDPIHETNEQGWPHAAPVGNQNKKAAKG